MTLSKYAPQIEALYAQNVTPEMIARGLNIPEHDVNEVLFATSDKFRLIAATKAAAGLDPADEMLQIALSIAREASSPAIKLAAVKFVRDDLKGRRDETPDTGINTEALAAIKESASRIEAATRQFLSKEAQVIDVK